MHYFIPPFLSREFTLKIIVTKEQLFFKLHVNVYFDK